MTAKNSTNSLVFQIDQLLDEASKLAKTERDPATFYQTLLQRAVLAVQAYAAAIWVTGPQSYPVAIAAHQLSELDRRSSKTQLAITETIEHCIETGQAKKLIAHSKTSSLSVFCCPYDSGSGSADSVVTIYFETALESDLASVYASFTEAVAEIAADFAARQNFIHPFQYAQATTEAAGNSSDWNQFQCFSNALHETLNVRSTAIALVNHGRSFYKCDRVLLAERSGQGFKIIAASGAALVNRKSETVGAIETLITQAFYRNEKPVIVHRDTSPLPKRLDAAIERYQTVSGNGFLLLSPLPDKKGRVKFVQVIESAEENDVARILKRIAIAEPQTALALSNAALHQAIPMRGLLSALGGARLGSGLRRLFLPLFFLTLVGLAIGALCLLQTDLIVAACGNIVAESQQNIFAAKDGVIKRLYVNHGDEVKANQLLIEMTSNQIETELSRIAGDIETQRKRLEAIEAIKSSLDRGSPDRQRELGRLSSQEIQSKQRMENLNVELDQMTREQERLQLRSPIAGSITTRDAKTKLLDRPVHRGDVLLQLVADDGKWLAKIRVPDSRISHLMKLESNNRDNDATQHHWDDQVPVRLSVATFPEKDFEGVIRSVSKVADIDNTTGKAFIIVTVAIKHGDDITFQPGSSVIARFNCGPTSVGYAWFNEFIDSIKYRFF